MKRWIWIPAIGVIAVMVIVLIRPGSSEGNIRRLIRNVQTTASDGINRQNPMPWIPILRPLRKAHKKMGCLKRKEPIKPSLP